MNTASQIYMDNPLSSNMMSSIDTQIQNAGNEELQQAQMLFQEYEMGGGQIDLLESQELMQDAQAKLGEASAMSRSLPGDLPAPSSLPGSMPGSLPGAPAAGSASSSSAGVSSSSSLQASQGLKAPSGDDWPDGTVQTAGGYIVMPDDSDRGFTVFTKDATGPDDQSHILYYTGAPSSGGKTTDGSTNNETTVKDKNGNAVFTFSQDSDFKLPDGTLLHVTTDGKADASNANAETANTAEGGVNITGVDIVNGNSHVNYAWANASKTFTINAPNDGIKFVAQDLADTNMKGHTFAVGVDADGRISMYQSNSGTIIGKVTGSSWSPDSAGMKTVLGNLIDDLNSVYGARIDKNKLLGEVGSDGNLSQFLDDLNGSLYDTVKCKAGWPGVSASDMQGKGVSTTMSSPKDFQNLVSAVKNQFEAYDSDNTGLASKLNAVLPTDNAIYGAYTLNVDTSNTNYAVAEEYKPDPKDPAYANELFMQMLETASENNSLSEDTLNKWQAYYKAAQKSGIDVNAQAQSGGLPPALPLQNQAPAGGLGDDPASMMNQLGSLSDGMSAYNEYGNMGQGNPYLRG